MNKERMTILADFLERLPSEAAFKLSSWTHCALGYAATVPEFIKLGFKTDKNAVTFRKNDQNYYHYNAGIQLLEIPRLLGYHLFSTSEYSRDACSKNEAIGRIRKAIEVWDNASENERLNIKELIKKI